MPAPVNIIEKRMRRIRAMSRLSRMTGWHGHIPTELMIEYRALERLVREASS